MDWVDTTTHYQLTIELEYKVYTWPHLCPGLPLINCWKTRLGFRGKGWTKDEYQRPYQDIDGKPEPNPIESVLNWLLKQSVSNTILTKFTLYDPGPVK